MLKIEGNEIPAPSDYLVGITDLTQTKRNANGNMIIERITTKRKLELAWRYLNKQQLAQVLSAVSPVFFTVEYLDPQTNGKRSGTFYCGDRKVGAMDYINGQIRWKDIKFSLIER